MDQTTAVPAGHAWLNYLQSIHDLQQQSLKQYQKFWNDYVESVQSARSDARSGLAEVQRTYVQDLQAALGSSDEQATAMKAYQSYIDALHELQSAGEREAVRAASDPEAVANSAAAMRDLWLDPDRTRRITESYHTYTEAAARWSTTVQERLAEANRKYMAALAEAADQDDAAATAKAAYEKYVEGVYGTYKSSVEEAQASADAAAENVHQATRKRSK